jgi:hypothetical protein
MIIIDLGAATGHPLMMGPADQDPRPESVDRETSGHAGGGRERVAGQPDDPAMDRCEAWLRRQAQRASQEQSPTDRETARSRRDAGP